MKIRRTVAAPKLADYFRFRFKYATLKDDLAYNTQIFNLFTFFCLLTLLSGVLGFWREIFWAIGVTNILLLLGLYLKTARLAQGVLIKRTTPKTGRERMTIDVHYDILNQTGFALENLAFMQTFDGVNDGGFLVQLPRTLPAQTRLRITKKIKLSGGMGVKTFAPVQLKLQDELGLFDFKVQFYQTDELEVFPTIEETPDLKNAISPEAITYGAHEIPKRGDSTLFIGTRDYRPGDPAKSINWKLTKKTGDVVVNVFEKNTNCTVTLLVDLDLDNQLGFGENSTWEGIKDLAMSLCSVEINKHNSIQVLANNLHIPFGVGKTQLSLIEKHFTFHELARATSELHRAPLHHLPPGGQIHYICPLVHTPKVEETLELLKRLHWSGQSVSIFVIDPFEEVRKSVRRELKSSILELERHARERFERHQLEFRRIGVSMVEIKIGAGLGLRPQLVKHAVELLEGR